MEPRKILIENTRIVLMFSIFISCLNQNALEKRFWNVSLIYISYFLLAGS